MKLQKSTDYALRILGYLNHTGEPSTLKGISETLDISYNNTIKLVAKLSKAGLLDTKLGRNGGFSLGPKFQDSTIKDIVEIIEGVSTLSPCSETQDCRFVGSCHLETTLYKVQSDINKVMDMYPLHNLRFTTNKEELLCQ